MKILTSWNDSRILRHHSFNGLTIFFETDIPELWNNKTAEMNVMNKFLRSLYKHNRMHKRNTL